MVLQDGSEGSDDGGQMEVGRHPVGNRTAAYQRTGVEVDRQAAAKAQKVLLPLVMVLWQVVRMQPILL